MNSLVDILGEGALLGGIGGLVGLVFGFSAQRSRFCMRAATVEWAEGQLGPRLAIWLIAFFAAVGLVQGAVATEWLDLSNTRTIASTGSFSGAILGGLAFGSGMILARGCPSRLLVLASSGNLRALITGLVLTLVAQAAYTGILSPVREAVSGLWTVPGGPQRDALALVGLGPLHAAALAAGGLFFATWLARRCQVRLGEALMGAGVGCAVALGWGLTYALSQVSFEVIPVASVSFTGPAADTLMVFVTQSEVVWSFGIGLVPGVALGAAIGAVRAGEWRIERFGAETPMERYLIGAVLMGVGAMSAGGCAVGAVVSGGAAMSLTALVAGIFMWIGAMATHWILVHWRSPATRPA